MESPIRYLMTVVIQEQDLETATRALTRLKVPVTRLVSSGGFLGRRNATLLIALAEGMQEQVVQALKESCRQRVEYMAMPLEGSPMPLPTPVPVTVGGATIFTLPVEYYEEV
ncbi:MAG: cyclic-di-AMP receptor [Candidatus Villigracilaceae bacterium]